MRPDCTGPRKVTQAETARLIANLVAPFQPENQFSLRPDEARVYLHLAEATSQAPIGH